MLRTQVATVVRVSRPLSASAPRLIFGGLFGTKEAKKKEIIEKQDDFEVDASAKIVILNKENSPKHKPFLAETDMPDFKIEQWKFANVPFRDIEATYSKDQVATIISDSYKELKGAEVKPEEYAAVELTDLPFRFQLGKLLQQKLGFDIRDHTLSRAHNLGYLYEELSRVVALRWSNERNPNAIVLREGDFSSLQNVFLSTERTESQQKKEFDRLVKKARNPEGENTSGASRAEGENAQ